MNDKQIMLRVIMRDMSEKKVVFAYENPTYKSKIIYIYGAFLLNNSKRRVL